ncbi:glycoside hydrolase family 43 protein [Rhodopirellula halodulae]|uniref:glycoside hydrolase family 43 protein n=1 Tax=Rhodopirellula halodulae TaxID=2894198 RepID=UPI0028F40675|nr:glycoside hydrolase family 43 protein [Rhodopirellula sp. JC737]
MKSHGISTLITPRIVAATFLTLLAWMSIGRTEDSTALDPTSHFTNPIAKAADPWVVLDEANSRYLWCRSANDRGIILSESPDLTSMGTEHLIWTAPDQGPYSKEVWAPELHLINERWHVYFAASDGDNANHLAYVLVSQTKDPFGSYDLHGPFATGDGEDGRSPNVWAIDMTVLEHNEKLYALWSGWDKPGSDNQYLYIAPMKSPTEMSGPRVRVCDNDDYLWERVEPDPSQRGLNEGPEVFQANDRTFVFYSCAASWLPTYKLGRLELIGDDPLDPASWKKHPQPAFQSTEEVFGVGHSCFAPTIDQQEWWHVFHSKVDRTPGWKRVIHLQPMSVDDDGTPNLGSPIPRDQAIRRPSK